MLMAKLKMNHNLIVREHQGAQDESLAPMMNMILLSSTAKDKDN
jgi:hypothetical protein